MKTILAILYLISRTTTMQGWSGAWYPCCWTPTWEGTISFMVGEDIGKETAMTEGDATVSFDHHNETINFFMESTANGEAIIKERILVHYKKGIQYRIDNDGKCVREKLTLSEMPAPCVPKSSEKVASLYYGTSSNVLDIVNYRLPEMEESYGYFTVTANGCIPVGAVLHGVIKKTKAILAEMKIIQFQNFTAGIKNASVFDLPHSCQDAEITTTKQTGMAQNWWAMFY